MWLYTSRNIRDYGENILLLYISYFRNIHSPADFGIKLQYVPYKVGNLNKYHQINFDGDIRLRQPHLKCSKTETYKQLFTKKLR